MLGSLVEKGLATPQQYPLTVNALQSACNQTSNREPVVSYDETTVITALEELKGQRLVRFVLPSHGRSVMRYRQVLDEALGLDDRQCAVLAVLLLRGPQTVGELRIRTERMARFEGLSEIEHELDLLGSIDEPLVRNVGRRPGQKEERWATLLTAAADPDQLSPSGAASTAAATPMAPAPLTHVGDAQAALRDAVGGVRAELAQLQAEVADIRRTLDELRENLGG